MWIFMFHVQPRQPQVRIPCPQSIANYTKYMGGVDLADQNRSYYGVGRESKKFWRYAKIYEGSCI